MSNSDYILITGVSGYVGEHYARHAAKHWDKVAGTFLANPVQIPGVPAVPLDATDPRAVDRLLRDMRPGAIIHCAAQTNTGWCQNYPAEARQAIVDATKHLCEAIRKYQPETRLIAFSTDLVFDGTVAPYAESASTKPLNVYGSLKCEAEQAVLALDQGVVLRSALIYGPPSSLRQSFLGWMVDAFVKKADLSLFQDEWRTPVLVSDLCSAVDLLMDAPISQLGNRIFHAGGPDSMNRVEMGTMLAGEFQLSAESIRPVFRNDLPGGELRARDVSLDSSKLAQLGWVRNHFQDGLKVCLQQWNQPQENQS